MRFDRFFAKIDFKNETCKEMGCFLVFHSFCPLIGFGLRNFGVGLFRYDVITLYVISLWRCFVISLLRCFVVLIFNL